ncbi:hypothetical protein D6D01_01661 [Aureobasidium pullulans]|uniref:Uncharacterized protein n=1 Tax=Aureobasidium pullulans TaxID=5580 RepID=A0A4S9LYE0_AURPU|nr:hypothetical protein D6D01_01661 [Aureobasidium pullulans]
MRDMPSLLPLAGTDCHNVAPQDGYHRYSSLPDLNMADPNLQPEGEGGVTPTTNQVPAPQGVGLTLDEQAATPSIADEAMSSVLSDSSSDATAFQERPTSRTFQASPGSTSAPTSSPAPSAASDGDEHRLSPEIWAESVAFEERVLMTNSANVARDRRRRRGAIQLDVTPLGPVFSLLPSLVSPSHPLSRLEGSDDDLPPPVSSSAADGAMPSTPRARLQRSFMPSEREGAGAILVPGLLRRLGRPFSGSWQGLSSPLGSVSSTDLPRVSCWSRLRRLFSRRRQ